MSHDASHPMLRDGTYRAIRVQRDGDVLHITLNNPDDNNALTIGEDGNLRTGSYPELVRLFGFLAADEHAEARSLRVVIIGGQPKELPEGKGWRRNFCMGGSPSGIVAKLVEMDASKRQQFTRMTVDLVRNMIRCPQFIISAVNGICCGAGMAIACASDYRVGGLTKSEKIKTRVGCLFNGMGLSGADMGVDTILPRLIGAGRAMAMMVGDAKEMVDGETMHAWGFFQEMTDFDLVVPTAIARAQRICAGNARHALRMTKRAYWDAFDIWDALDRTERIQALCMDRSEMAEGLAAWREKRPANWPALD